MRCLAAVLTLCLPLSAQVPPGHAIVLSRQAAAPVAVLLDVDLASGKVQTLDRFPGDTAVPLAISYDPIRGDVVVALDQGRSSQVVRLTYRGTKRVFSKVMGSIPGRVRALIVSDDGDLFAVTEGSSGLLSRLSRTGGTAQPLALTVRAAALHSFGVALQAVQTWVAEDGAGATPPQIRLIDLRSGRTVAGPHLWRGFGARITGLGELPTGVPRHFVTDDQGRLSLSVAWQSPSLIRTTPSLPAGGTRALRVDPSTVTAFVLGGRAHPWLKSVQGWSSPVSWKMLAGPLPGDPVDFDLGPRGEPGVDLFGRGCSNAGPAPSMMQGNGGPPRIGNASFALAASQLGPGRAVLLSLGASEQSWGTLPLPIVLPGGCSLLIAAELLFAHRADSLGRAAQLLPIPANSALHGVTFFAQWLDLRALTPLVVATSQAAAVHVSR